MKHKRGKGRKIRRLVRCFKLKTGGNKFTFSGKGTSWGNQSMVPLAIPRAKWIKKLYKRKGGDR